MATSWILVADSSRARLFRLTDDGGQVEELLGFVNPDADIRSATRTRPPRTHDRLGHARHIIEPHTSLKERSISGFTAELRTVLERGLASNAYQQLVLIAPPLFLGALRQTLGKQVRSRVAVALGRELTEADSRSISRYVARALCGTAVAGASPRPGAATARPRRPATGGRPSDAPAA